MTGIESPQQVQQWLDMAPRAGGRIVLVDGYEVSELAGCATVVLGTLDRPANGPRGFTALSKPVTRRRLLEALKKALGFAANESVASTGLAAVRTFAGVTVLLAEDNPVNQEVAAAMLELQGCVVDLVGDGQSAFEAATTGSYDLVLMDWHMPVMDGLQATARIREHEKANARRAAAADAATGQQRLRRTDPDALSERPREAAGEHPLGPAASDRRAVEIAAHTLKSSSANVGARMVRNTCAELEQLARTDGSWDAVRALLPLLESSTAHAAAEVSLLLAGKPGSTEPT